MVRVFQVTAFISITVGYVSNQQMALPGLYTVDTRVTEGQSDFKYVYWFTTMFFVFLISLVYTRVIY